MSAPGHQPTTAQIAQLATLQATATAAGVTLAAAQVALASAQSASQAAENAAAEYQSYIYGGANKPGIYDEGGPNVT
jgi:hypothetical protein